MPTMDGAPHRSTTSGTTPGRQLTSTGPRGPTVRGCSRSRKTCQQYRTFPKSTLARLNALRPPIQRRRVSHSTNDTIRNVRRRMRDRTNSCAGCTASQGHEPACRSNSSPEQLQWSQRLLYPTPSRHAVRRCRMEKFRDLIHCSHCPYAHGFSKNRSNKKDQCGFLTQNSHFNLTCHDIYLFYSFNLSVERSVHPRMYGHRVLANVIVRKLGIVDPGSPTCKLEVLSAVARNAESGGLGVRA